MNCVIMSGKIAGDVKVNDGAMKRANFRLKVADTYVKKDGSTGVSGSTFNCSAWGRTAEAASMLSDGDSCDVVGRLQNRSYEKDGAKVWVTEVVVDRIGVSGQDAPPITPAMKSARKPVATADDDDPMPF